MKPNTLSIAVASGRIGYVYLIDGEVRDWGVSVVATRSIHAVKRKTEHLIHTYQPDLIVTEKLSVHTRKSGRTIANVYAVEEVTTSSETPHIAVEHVQQHPNKYDEMDILAKKYPVLAQWLPSKRKLWESEDRRTTIWEALALVEQAGI